MNKRIRKKHSKKAIPFSNEELHELYLLAIEVRAMVSAWQLYDYFLERAEKHYTQPETTL